jgi:hypothetical protein
LNSHIPSSARVEEEFAASKLISPKVKSERRAFMFFLSRREYPLFPEKHQPRNAQNRPLLKRFQVAAGDLGN